MNQNNANFSVLFPNLEEHTKYVRLNNIFPNIRDAYFAQNRDSCAAEVNTTMIIISHYKSQCSCTNNNASTALWEF